MDAMIPVCIFTHSGAALRLPWAVRGVLVVGLIPVVCQDGGDPLPPHVLGWLASEGVEVRTTNFPRRGNLNGIECAAGICRELEAACIRHGSSHAIKLDDDTLIGDPQVFLNWLQFAAIGLTWSEGSRPGAYGLAYCLSRQTAAQVAASLEAWPEIDETAPEDLTIWWLAKHCGPCLDQPFATRSGAWSAMPHGSDAQDALARFSVLTVGNVPAGGWKDRDRQIAGELRRLVEHLAQRRQRGRNARRTGRAQIRG